MGLSILSTRSASLALQNFNRASAPFVAATALGLLSVACGGNADGGPSATDGNLDEGPADGGGMMTGTNGGTAGESPFKPGAADPCVDMPDTEYLNDDLCLEPPPADMGYQLHYGPDDYDNPDEVAKFVLEPGGEDLTCQFRFTSNQEERYIAEEHTRLRSGTHHMIVWGSHQEVANPPADGTLLDSGCQVELNYIFFTGAQAALGPEGGVQDIPIPGAKAENPPENEGLASKILPHSSVGMEMHYINTTDKPLLKEAWINEIYTPEDEVKQIMDPIFFIGGLGMNVQPKSQEIVKAGPCEQPPDTSEPVRVLGITAHAHSHTHRMSAYINHADGTSDLIYESYTWEEPLNAQFDSVHEHPEPGNGMVDGAYSGIMTLDPGDTFSWECDVRNNDLDIPLVFANKADTAEMCNIFGFMTPGVGGNWGCFQF